MNKEKETVADGICRMVPHLARTYGTDQDAVWAEMYIQALDFLTFKQTSDKRIQL